MSNGVEIVLILLPAMCAMYCLFVQHSMSDTVLLLAASFGHLLFTVILSAKDVIKENALFGVDSLSFFFLLILSILFMASSFYSITFIRRMGKSGRYNKWYAPAMLLFLSSMTGVLVSRNLGLIWVFVEAATLTSAILIYHNKTKESLEAVWKYLFICSVGIALAFIGVIIMLEAGSSIKGLGLNIDSLTMHARELSPVWLVISFVFAFIGYGTKMGLAPMHTWLPDAYSQAPAPASALFSGALLNCSFLAILRYYQIIVNTDIAGFASTMFLVLGMFSIFVSAVFVIRVKSFKRKLAYSSIEHIGILAVGTGIGGLAIYASMFHSLCHSLTKHLMFLNAGNFIHTYKTTDVDKVRGGFMVLPNTSWLLMLGVLALLGLPPFGMFFSKFMIFKEMVANGMWIMLVTFSISLIVITYGLFRAVVQMNFIGENGQKGLKESFVKGEDLFTTLPQWVFIAILFYIGISIPKRLGHLIYSASAILFGTDGGNF